MIIMNLKYGERVLQVDLVMLMDFLLNNIESSDIFSKIDLKFKRISVQESLNFTHSQ